MLRHRLFVLLTSCLLFCTEYAFAQDTLSFNQSLGISDVLISNGNTFKLGFFNPSSSSYYYVGVMYNTPGLAVVWVANRDRPLNDSNGSLEISENGDLVILDGQKEILWSTNASDQAANATAKLLDTGNFVLQNNLSSTNVWESFQHPSDSFLPEMRLTTDLTTNEKSIVTSWRSPSDPGLGSFTGYLEPLPVPQFVVRKGNDLYWRTGPWNNQIFTGISDMVGIYQNRFLIVNDNPHSAYLTYIYRNAPGFVYFTLNSSGILEQKIFSGESEQWDTMWASVQTECDVYGMCGAFGSCDPRTIPICTCLRGFQPMNPDEWDSGNWTSGCVRKTALQCERYNSSGGSEKWDGFVRLNAMNIPDHLNVFPLGREECSSQCLNNCLCLAHAYFSGIGCMHWNESLIDVKKFASGGADLYLRLAYSELDKKKDWKPVIVTVIVLGFTLIVVCIYFVWRFCKGRKTKKQKGRSAKVDGDDIKLDNLSSFDFEILLNATSKFDPINKLGEGGFGPVYKGKLANGPEIAVKRLGRSSNQGLNELKNEVEVISKLRHRNLVRVLGCCLEFEEKMLVYEYIPNGSLDSYLFGSPKHGPLDWNMRMLIIEGISRGLMYLHHDSIVRIVHRDLKPSNILLDQDMNPKISDFGMARIFGGNQNQFNTDRVVGTLGYMAPECVEGIVSEKSDVYSFGIVLLEIVSGRRNTSFYDDDQHQSLVAYAWESWNEKKIMNLLDPLIYNPQLEQEVLRCTHIGLLCVQETAQDRPSILSIVSMLNSEIVELSQPNRPPFVVHRKRLQMQSPDRCQYNASVNGVTLSTVEAR